MIEGKIIRRAGQNIDKTQGLWIGEKKESTNERIQVVNISSLV